MLTIALLGPVELRRDGAQLPLPAGRTTELLVRLAFDAGVPVRADRLIEDLWPGAAVGVSPNTLQAMISRLRRALGDPDLVRGGPAGYRLDVDPRAVDALEVLRLAESAGARRAAGDAEGTLRESIPALALFRGDVLPGIDGEWVQPMRTRLEEARLSLTEDSLTARIDLGAAGELVGELEALVGDHPLREGLWALLITALYRSGRQGDALAASRRARRWLADELGLDPGPELQALERQVLAHDDALEPATPPGRGPLGRAGHPAGNVPVLSASLVGRANDVDAVRNRTGSARLVTVVGPAGVGKTRLAIEVARGSAVPGGAWLARLETARGAPSIWASIGEAFGVGEATAPLVLDRLRGFDLLLVVDNCEHLVGVLPAELDRMLAAAPGLRVLATSQVPLGIDGEHVHPLGPLSPADSVELFAARAAQHRTVSLDDEETAATVEAVCRALDGLPLAIELAAARTKVLSVREIARRLDDRFPLLTDPSGHGSPRRRALRAALAWSYDLLFPDDQRGWWALACFSGGAPLAGVEAVLTALGVPTAATVDVVDRLVDRSLVTVDVVEGEPRYRLLESVRAFGLERLHEAGEAPSAQLAHATWVAEAAARAASGTRGPDQPVHLSVARTERANIDAALAWTAGADPLLGLRIAHGFAWTWAVLGGGPEAARRIRSAVAAAGPAAPPRERATALLVASWLEAAGGDLGQALADVEDALRDADDEAHAVGQVYLAFLRTQQGRPRDVLKLLAGCRPELRSLGFAWEEGASWLLSAWAEIAVGDIGRARQACDESLRLLGALQDDWALIHAEALLGNLAQAEHRFPEATAHLTRAAAAAGRLGFAAAEALHLCNLGRAQQQGGDLVAAGTTLESAVAKAEATGDLRLAALARVRLGRVFRAAGAREGARTAVEAAQRWYASAGGGEGAGLAAYLVAGLDVDDGSPGAADSAGAVLAAARQAGDAEVQLLALDLVARIHAGASRTGRASAVLEEADALLPQVRHLVTDADRIDRAEALRLLTVGSSPDRAGGVPVFDAIVLAGGRARRFGGIDKVMLEVSGRTLLETALNAVRGARAVAVVGGRREVRGPGQRLRWTSEVPPGGGPLAGLAAGVAALDPAAAVPVVVLAADLPYVDPPVVSGLLAALDAAAGSADLAALADGGGRIQLLAAAYDGTALAAALAGIGDPWGKPVRLLLERLRPATVADPRAARDCDTPQDWAMARRELEEQG